MQATCQFEQAGMLLLHGHCVMQSFKIIKLFFSLIEDRNHTDSHALRQFESCP